MATGLAGRQDRVGKPAVVGDTGGGRPAACAALQGAVRLLRQRRRDGDILHGRRRCDGRSREQSRYTHYDD